MYNRLDDPFLDIISLWELAKKNGFNKINVRFPRGIVKCKRNKKTETSIIYLYSMPDYYYIKTTDLQTGETWDEVQSSHKVRFAATDQVYTY